MQRHFLGPGLAVWDAEAAALSQRHFLHLGDLGGAAGTPGLCFISNPANAD